MSQDTNSTAGVTGTDLDKLLPFRMAVANLPLPNGTHQYQHGFVDAKSAVLDILRATLPAGTGADERALFHACHTKMDLTRQEDGTYASGWTQIAWEGWQGRPAQAAQPNPGIAILHDGVWYVPYVAQAAQPVAWRYRTKGGKFWQVTADPAVAGTMGGHTNIEVRGMVDAAATPIYQIWYAGSGGWADSTLRNYESAAPDGRRIVYVAPVQAAQPVASLPAQLPDEAMRYVMECSGMNNLNGARRIRSIYHFIHEALTKPAAGVAQPVASADARHPLQPLLIDPHGRVRFKRNAIVDYLANGKLNELAAMDFPQEDWEQLAQLIGYSLSGFGTLSYATDETYERAAMAAPSTSGSKP